MGKIQSINFDDGYKSFCINDDESRVIRFNPKDINLIERLDQAKKNANNKIKELNIGENKVTDLNNEEDVEETLTIFNDLNKFLLDQVDMLFGKGAGVIVFGEQSPLTTINGKTIFEGFLEGAIKIIKPYIEEESDKKEKYIKENYKKYYAKLVR